MKTAQKLLLIITGLLLLFSFMSVLFEDFLDRVAWFDNFFLFLLLTPVSLVASIISLVFFIRDINKQRKIILALPLLFSITSLLTVSFFPIEINRDFFLSKVSQKGTYIGEMSGVNLTFRSGSTYEVEEFAIPFHQAFYSGPYTKENGKFTLKMSGTHWWTTLIEDGEMLRSEANKELYFLLEDVSEEKQWLFKRRD